MKISIITTCFNSENTIEDTLRSVEAQDYPDVEYIVVDGGSTDGTLPIIEKYKSKISKFISGKDQGIYDALNKGIGIATGEIIGILHSDDVFASQQVLSKISSIFYEKKCEGMYADLQYVDRKNTGRVIRNWKSGEYREGLFLEGWMPPHPTFFVRKECYERYGLFNTTFASAADYELMLRFIHRYKIKIAYLPEVIVKMRVGGISNTNILNRIRANLEDRRAWKINDLKPRWDTLLRKPLSKLPQFF